MRNFFAHLAADSVLDQIVQCAFPLAVTQGARVTIWMTAVSLQLLIALPWLCEFLQPLVTPWGKAETFIEQLQAKS